MKTSVSIAAVVVALSCVVPVAHCGEVIVYPQDCNQTRNGTTLNAVLNGGAENDALYQLQTGTHCITNFSYVRDLRNLTFSGNWSHPESVRVTCAKKVGLGFVNISGLTLEGMTVTACGVAGSSNFEEFQYLAQNKTDYFYHLYEIDVIAMLVGLVSNFTLSSFAIIGTEGLGLLAVNLQESTSVESSNFSNNHPLSCYRLPLNIKTGVNISENDQTGGGAFFAYHDFKDSSKAPTTLDIVNSSFLANSYCGLEAVIELDYRFSDEVHKRGYSLGAGGGLSVMLAQTEYVIDVTVESSLFRNNTSKFGGGAYIALYAGVNNNSITFYNCDFFKNGLAGSIVQALEYSTSGSALYVVKDIAHPMAGNQFITLFTNATNTVLLRNCSLVGNRASVAGAVNIFSLYSSRAKDTVTFDNCIISGNEALVGAAFYIGEQKQSGVQPGITIVFRDVKLTRNRILFESIGNIATSKSDSSAAIEAQAVNITIEGNSLLSDNYASAIRATSSIIYISDNVVLCNNSGLFGGAMHLVSSSFLVLTNNSHARFENNTGAVEGGAFYINLYNYAPDIYYQDCFLYFGDLDILCFTPRICDNVKILNFTLELIYNKSPLGSLIFGSTLDSCPWSLPLREEYGDPSSHVLDIMYNNLTEKFNFSSPPTTVNAVTTPSKKLVIHEPAPLNVAPGELFWLNVTGYDHFNLSTPVLLSSKPSDNLQNISSSLGSSNFSFLNGGEKDSVPVIVTGRQNVTNVDIYLYATDSYAQAKFQVNLTECAPLVAFVYQDGRCQCERGMASDIECNATSMSLMVPNDHWVGPGPNGELMVAKCISDYCSLGERKVKPPNFDSQCHTNYRRSGILCGRCEEGYSVTLGSHRCKLCNNNNGLALILLFAVSGVIIVFGISFLRITISDGYLNTILFYSNILSIYIPILDEGSRLSNIFVVVAWFNLSYGIEQCFYSGMTALAHTSLQLVFPAYLFLLMLGIMMLAKKSGPLSRLFSSAKFSGAKLFATLILMSYTTVLQTCLKILGAVRVHTLDGEVFSLWRTDPNQSYFQDSHITMVVISVLLLVFIILPVPILLIFPALTFSTRLGVKIKPILDAFWAPFRTKFRFFVGLRLLLRVFPSVFANQVSRPLNVILLGIFSIAVLFLQVLVWPFEGFLQNAFDFFFISNIIILVMGTLYFEIDITAHQENQGYIPYHRAQYAYFTVFIAMAYVAYVLIIVWHIVQRFPSIRKTLKILVLKVRRQKTNKTLTDCSRVSETSPILHIQRDSDESSYSEDNPGPLLDSREIADAEVRTASHRKSQPEEKKPTVVNYSVLREPLLEEGVAELVPAAATN